MRKTIAVCLIACAIAAAVPLWLHQGAGPAKAQSSFPGWPHTFAGAPLRELPLSLRERQLLSDFPGRVGRFACTRSDLVIRWVTSETRMLHPASDCYRALGYTVKPLPLYVDSGGRRWGAFQASRAGRSVYVREQIIDPAGRSFSDVSAWYWSALLGKSQGPWWVFTVVAGG